MKVTNIFTRVLNLIYKGLKLDIKLLSIYDLFFVEFVALVKQADTPFTTLPSLQNGPIVIDGFYLTDRYSWETNPDHEWNFKHSLPRETHFPNKPLDYQQKGLSRMCYNPKSPYKCRYPTLIHSKVLLIRRKRQKLSAIPRDSLSYQIKLDICLSMRVGLYTFSH